ncbi:MAG TPA: nitroreductase family protein [Gaiellaceae bacterium]|nr:nitroreductase family protein [Gaiellaceae bacterium]
MEQRPSFVPLAFERRGAREEVAASEEFLAEMLTRRSVRAFSRDPVPRAAVENAIAAAGTAPSGANLQPWTFVLVSDPGLKRAIREAAEEEERRNYGERMPEAWLAALEPLGTDAVKPHLEDAPFLVVVFEQAYGLQDGRKVKHYYVRESVGIAVGFFLAAIHHAGLAALTHTPSPMGFLRELLGRPENERAYVVVPVGYPAERCLVPDIVRKPLDEILVRAD